jgi:hypothetical protein
VSEHRERVLSQLRLLVENNGSRRAFPKAYGGLENNGANLAGFMELVLADPSLQIKSGVQWGLFGSAIYQLGTKKHHDAWLRDVIELELPGAFAMTEIGHGSDVASIGTTATYDPETEEFVINTPFRGRGRTTSATRRCTGRAATVFAQLITGGVNYGVHCFFVPIRDEEGEMLPGIQSEDDGVKGGLNGIDNGRLAFDHVRVPRFNLLNRYGDVASDGTYTSDIPSPGRRFFTMLGALVQGRVRSTAPRRPARPSPSTSPSPTRTSAASSTRDRAAMRSCCSTTASTSGACCPPGAELRAVLRQRRVAAQVRRRVLGSHRHPAGARRPRDARRRAQAPLDVERAVDHPGGARGVRRIGLSPRTAWWACTRTSTST